MPSDSISRPLYLATEVEKIVRDRGCDHLEAIIIFASENDLDFEDVGAVAKKDPSLKAKIRFVAEKLHLVDTEGAKLPIEEETVENTK